jgi:hypothetical protein
LNLDLYTIYEHVRSTNKKGMPLKLGHPRKNSPKSGLRGLFTASFNLRQRR